MATQKKDERIQTTFQQVGSLLQAPRKKPSIVTPKTQRTHGKSKMATPSKPTNASRLGNIPNHHAETELRSKIRHLENNLNELKREDSQKTHKFENETRQLNKQLEQTKRQQQAFEITKNSLERSNTMLKWIAGTFILGLSGMSFFAYATYQDVMSYDQEVTTLNSQIIQKDDRILALEQEEAALITKTNSLNKSLALANTELESAKTRLTNTQNELDRSQQELANQKSLLASTVSKSNIQSEQLNLLETETLELKAALELDAQNIASLYDKVLELETEKSELKATQQALQETIIAEKLNQDTYSSEIDKIQSELTKSTNQQKKLTLALSEKTAELEALNSTRETLTRDIADMKIILEQKNARVSEQDRMIEEIEAKLKTLESQLTENP